MKLYELTNEYIKIQDELYDDETGKINESALEQINEIEESIKDKCIAVTKIFKNMEAERKAIEEEKKNMEIREKSYKKRIEYLKEYLIDNMQKTGIQKISCPQFEIKLRTNPVSVDLDDFIELEDEYMRIKKEPDKIKIKEHLQNGVLIEGARLIQKTGIVIK